MSHEELDPYHRLLGRIIVFLMAVHSSLYLNFYVQKGLLYKRLADWDVILRLLAISQQLSPVFALTTTDYSSTFLWQKPGPYAAKPLNLEIRNHSDIHMDVS